MIFPLHFSVWYIFSPSFLLPFTISVHKKNALSSLVPWCWPHWKLMHQTKDYTSNHICMSGLPSLSNRENSDAPGKAFQHFQPLRVLKVNLFMWFSSHPRYLLQVQIHDTTVKFSDVTEKPLLSTKNLLDNGFTMIKKVNNVRILIKSMTVELMVVTYKKTILNSRVWESLLF